MVTIPQQPANTENPRFINPFSDFGFKLLFGEEANLIDFLNDLLQDEQGKIVEITYLNSERLGGNSSERKAFFDLYCTNERGERFIVELQRTKQQHFKDRMVFYSSIPIREQAPRGDEWDYELKPMYMIAILNFVFPDNAHNLDKYRYDVQLADIKTGQIFYDKLKLICLELPKFTQSLEELKNHFEKWMYTLKHLHMLQEVPATLQQDKTFARVFSMAEIANLSPENRKAYDLSLKDYRDYTNSMRSMRQEGIEEGLQQGRQQGAENRNLEIARNMMQEGFAIPTIQKMTGLNQEAILKLQQPNSRSTNTK